MEILVSVFFFFKQKTAYEMRISDWSSDVCSSDLFVPDEERADAVAEALGFADNQNRAIMAADIGFQAVEHDPDRFSVDRFRRESECSQMHCAAPVRRCRHDMHGNVTGLLAMLELVEPRPPAHVVVVTA